MSVSWCRALAASAPAGAEPEHCSFPLCGAGMSSPSYSLGVEGQEDGGALEITGTTTLSTVRQKFPVPDEYSFAVP